MYALSNYSLQESDVKNREKKMFFNYVVFFLAENNINQKPARLSTLRTFEQLETSFPRKL